MISAFGQKNADNRTTALLDEYLTRMAAFGFSGAVIVERDGKFVLRKGYGFANKENRIPFTVDTPFSVASISKQFTAAAVLRLEEQGKLSLDDPITKFFKEVPPDKQKITIKNLLNHTSGWDDNYSGTNITDRDQAIKSILNQPLANPVGEKFNYSNDGYDLAAAIVEIVSGMKITDFIRRNFFNAAGMKRAGFAGESNFWKHLKVAHPYNYTIDNGSPEFDLQDWEGRGSADVIVSAADLYRWELSLREDKVLSAAIKQKMFAPAALESNGGYYGCGWHIFKTERGTTEFYHGGSNVPRGFTASYSRYPDEKTTIIIFVNTMIDEVGFLRAVKPGIVDITFGKKVELPPAFIKVKSPQFQRYAGIYETGSGAKFVLQITNDDLMLGAIGQEAINFLTAPDRETEEKLTDYNKRTGVFLEKTVPDPTGIPTLKATLDQFAERHGKYVGGELLGTYPVSIRYKTSTSFVKLSYEKGDEIIRLVRNGNNVYSIAGNRYPALTPVMPAADGNFIAFYPLLGKTVRVEFQTSEGGKVTGLKLTTNTGQMFEAKKIS